MSTWAEQIEKDLAWREAEMGALKLLLASAPAGSDRHRALMRACCAMIYAHYEGFCKFCWTLMLDTIEKQSLARQDLVDPLARRAMAAVFRALRGDTSDVRLWDFATNTFATLLKERAAFPDEIDTESNLWPAVAKRINVSIGIECPMFDAHDAELRQLVGRRNKIAHGEKLEMANLAQLQKFEHAAVVAMHDLAIAVVDCLEKKTYLRAGSEGVTVT
jgi:hypothetical protein